MTWLDFAQALWDAFYGLVSASEELVEHLPTPLQCFFDWCSRHHTGGRLTAASGPTRLEISGKQRERKP